MCFRRITRHKYRRQTKTPYPVLYIPERRDKKGILQLDIEVGIEKDEEQDEEETKDDQVNKHGSKTCLHVHEIDRPFLARDLKHQPW